MQKLASSNAHYVPAISIYFPPRQRATFYTQLSGGTKKTNLIVLVSKILGKKNKAHDPATLVLLPSGSDTIRERIIALAFRHLSLYKTLTKKASYLFSFLRAFCAARILRKKFCNICLDSPSLR